MGVLCEICPLCCVSCVQQQLCSLSGLLWSARRSWDKPQGNGSRCCSHLEQSPRMVPGCWHCLKLMALAGTWPRERFQQGGMCRILSCWHPFLQGSPPACPTALLNPLPSPPSHPRNPCPGGCRSCREAVEKGKDVGG